MNYQLHEDNDRSGAKRSGDADRKSSISLFISGTSLLFAIVALVFAVKHSSCECNSTPLAGQTASQISSELAGPRIWNGLASFNAFTVNWEAHNKTAWLKTVTPDIDFAVQYNSYSTKVGAENVWKFRGFLPNATGTNYLLWTNTYDSWLFDDEDPHTLHARMTTFLRGDCDPQTYPGFCMKFAPAGSLYQMGRWTCKLDPGTGKIKYMHQEVVYALWTDQWNKTKA